MGTGRAPAVRSMVVETFARYAADFPRIVTVAAILLVPTVVLAWIEFPLPLLLDVLELVAFGGLIAISGAAPGGLFRVRPGPRGMSADRFAG